MKRILFVTGIQVFPPLSGGQSRSANLAKSLARSGYEVFLYSYTGRKADYLAGRPSGETAIEPGLVEYVDRSRWRGLLQWLTYKLGIANLWFSLPFRWVQLSRVLESRLVWAELVVMDFPYHVPLLKFAPAKPKVMNSHNLEHQVPYRGGKLAARWVERLERRTAREVDAVLSCGKEDTDFFRREGSAKLTVVNVPNSLDLDALKGASGEGRSEVRRRLGLSDATTVFVFLASKYLPNYEGFLRLKSFVKENPNTLEKLDVAFLVIGSVTEEPSTNPRLKALGFVPSTVPYFEAADFSLNLVVSGSGTNVKMLEYFAHRRPIVSTEFGARGFELVPNEDYLVLDEMEATLRRALEMTKEERRAMADRALGKNRYLCDMKIAITENVRPVLERLAAAPN